MKCADKLWTCSSLRDCSKTKFGFIPWFANFYQGEQSHSFSVPKTHSSASPCAFPLLSRDSCLFTDNGTASEGQSVSSSSAEWIVAMSLPEGLGGGEVKSPALHTLGWYLLDQCIKLSTITTISFQAAFQKAATKTGGSDSGVGCQEHQACAREVSGPRWNWAFDCYGWGSSGDV